MLAKPNLASVGLFSVFAIAGAGFWTFNNAKLREHGELTAHGIAQTGYVEAVIYSHKTCNSSVDVWYLDGAHHRWKQRFQTCYAPVIGNPVALKYLPGSPQTAMLLSGESPYDEATLDRGRGIGAAVGAFGLFMAIRHALKHFRQT